MPSCGDYMSCTRTRNQILIASETYNNLIIFDIFTQRFTRTEFYLPRGFKQFFKIRRTIFLHHKGKFHRLHDDVLKTQFTDLGTDPIGPILQYWHVPKAIGGKHNVTIVMKELDLNIAYSIPGFGMRPIDVFEDKEYIKEGIKNRCIRVDSSFEHGIWATE